MDNSDTPAMTIQSSFIMDTGRIEYIIEERRGGRRFVWFGLVS